MLFSLCEEMLTIQRTGMCFACPNGFFVSEGCGLTVLSVAPRSICVSDLGTMHANIVHWSQLKSFMS